MTSLDVIKYCEDNSIDISMFSAENRSDIYTTDSRVVYAIQQLLDAGFSYSVIASALLISPRFIAAIKSGEYLTKPVKAVRVLDTGKISALRKAGWTDDAIAKDMNLPLSVVESTPK